MAQNIYDNEAFFLGYSDIRNSSNSYNNLLEQPLMQELLPDLVGKKVLDLGCGFGFNCVDFVKRGAAKVVGVDISKKMLAVAKDKSASVEIEYINLDMLDISSLSEKFDLIYSSLAFHYIDNFKKLSTDIFALLKSGGQLLYSQEHPIITAPIDDCGSYNKDALGQVESYTFSNYNQSGRRQFFWIADEVVIYHRPMGEIITTLAQSGFRIEAVLEPTPREEALKALPILAKEFLAPAFMVVKARK